MTGRSRCMAARPNNTLDSTRTLQHKLYLAAKWSPNRRFHALYDRVFREDVLRRAWLEVRANQGAPGVDAITIADIEAAGAEEFLGKLAGGLQDGSYRPQPVRRVWIPKPDKPGKMRPLGIASVADRVVQQAVKIVIEPIVEADFLPCSYGFRPRRSAHDALQAMRDAVRAGRTWVVDADIESFFDRLDRDLVLECLRERISDRRVLKLIRAILSTGVLDGAVLSNPAEGVPQGGPRPPHRQDHRRCRPGVLPRPHCPAQGRPPVRLLLPRPPRIQPAAAHRPDRPPAAPRPGQRRGRLQLRLPRHPPPRRQRGPR